MAELRMTGPQMMDIIAKASMLRVGGELSYRFTVLVQQDGASVVKTWDTEKYVLLIRNQLAEAVYQHASEGDTVFCKHIHGRWWIVREEVMA